MKLAYSTIINGDNVSYPGRIATVIRVTGGPLRCSYLPLAENQEPTLTDETDFFLDLVSKQVGEDGETTAVVISGVEPLWQGNAVAELTRKLREIGIFVKVETSGFYSTEVHVLANTASFISLDFKHLFQREKLLPLVGEKVNFEVFHSNFLKSLAFLEHGKAFKEVKTTVIPGINDSMETVREMAKAIGNSVDQYALCQFVPWPLPLTDSAFEKIVPPTRLHLLELAQVCRAYVGRAVVRCYESEDQEALPRAASAGSKE